MGNKINIAFYILSEKGLIVLKEFLNHQFKVTSVTTIKDESQCFDIVNDVEKLCKSRNIPYNSEGKKHSGNPNIIIAAGWRKLLKFEIYQKLIILHDSLLPKYRGFAPVVSSLICGERKLGVSVILADENIDTGNILVQSEIEIKYPITIKKALDLNNSNYISATRKLIDILKSGDNLLGVAQNNNEATYSIWLDEEDYKIDWTKTSNEIKRMIDAVGYPYKGAFTQTKDNCFIRILKCEEISDVVIVNRTPGKIFKLSNGNPVVICTEGLIEITDAYFEEGLSALPWKKLKTRFI